jgi:hypothetical protein
LTRPVDAFEEGNLFIDGNGSSSCRVGTEQRRMIDWDSSAFQFTRGIFEATAHAWVLLRESRKGFPQAQRQGNNSRYARQHFSFLSNIDTRRLHNSESQPNNKLGLNGGEFYAKTCLKEGFFERLTREICALPIVDILV